MRRFERAGEHVRKVDDALTGQKQAGSTRGHGSNRPERRGVEERGEPQCFSEDGNLA